MSCLDSFDRVCRKIVMPTRHQINEKDMIDRKFRGIGPSYELIRLQNKRGQELSTIIFFKQSSYPTIIYLHGNGGNKLEVLHLVKVAEDYPINFAAFDFSGCGKSGGEFITYGQQQVDDINAVVNFMINNYGSKTIFLWGRSMGASLGLLYGSKYPNQIRGMILDSPFRSLQKVVFNVASSTQTIIPNFLISIGVFFVKQKVQNIVHEDIFDVDYSLSYDSLISQKIPLLFAFSTRDSVVKQQDVMEMFYLYNGNKKLSHFSCLHPQDRPKEFIFEALQYLSSIVVTHYKAIGEGLNSNQNFKRKIRTASMANLRNKWNN